MNEAQNVLPMLLMIAKTCSFSEPHGFCPGLAFECPLPWRFYLRGLEADSQMILFVMPFSKHEIHDFIQLVLVYPFYFLFSGNGCMLVSHLVIF